MPKDPDARDHAAAEEDREPPALLAADSGFGGAAFTAKTASGCAGSRDALFVGEADLGPVRGFVGPPCRLIHQFDVHRLAGQ